MRKLGIKDAFTLARLIKAANAKNELVEFANKVNTRQKANQNVDVEEVGIEFIFKLLETVSDTKIEQEFYKLYADIKETTVDDASLTDLATFTNDIKQIVRDNDLKSFFRSASILTQKH